MAGKAPQATTTSNGPTSTSEAPLKQLAFVPEMGSKGINMAASAYTTVKASVPASVSAKLSEVEERVGSISAPYVAAVQDKGTEVLRAVDAKVDQAVASATSIYQSNSAYLTGQIEKQKEYHSQNLQSFNAARAEYLKKVEESVEYVKSKGVSGLAKEAMDEVTTRVAKAKELPSYLLAQVHEAYEKLAALPVVKIAIDTTRPAVDAALSAYTSVHDAVVGSSIYKKGVDMGREMIDKAQENSLVKSASTKLSPYIMPIAGPAYESLAASPYVQAAVAHLTPTA